MPCAKKNIGKARRRNGEPRIEEAEKEAKLTKSNDEVRCGTRLDLSKENEDVSEKNL